MIMLEVKQNNKYKRIKKETTNKLNNLISDCTGVSALVISVILSLIMILLVIGFFYVRAKLQSIVDSNVDYVFQDYVIIKNPS